MSETEWNKESLFTLYAKQKNTQELIDNLTRNSCKHYRLKGMLGSSTGLFIANLFTQLPRPNLVVLSDKESAAYFYNDLTNLLDEDRALFYPSSFKRSAQYNKLENSNILLRTETLNKITNNDVIVVSFPEALVEKVVSREEFTSNTLPLEVGEEININDIIDFLVEYKFERVDFVYEPGQFSVRGSIIDIFSFSFEYPFRLDFFGDEIDSMRTFDIEKQLSVSKLEKIEIIPDIQNKLSDESRISFFEFIPSETIVWLEDMNFLKERISSIYNTTITNYDTTKEENRLSPEEFLISANSIEKQLENCITLEFGNKSFFNTEQCLVFNTSKQPEFNKNFNLLSGNLVEKIELGYLPFVLSNNQKQIDRLKAVFETEETDQNIEFIPVIAEIHEGFIDHDLKFCCYTDHQIFNRYQKFKLKNRKAVAGKEALTLKEINTLSPGDYVVHVDHGVGIFGGLETIEINGKLQEAIRLIYKDNDVLYASIHSLHRISKYREKDSAAPKIHKLGSGVWQRMKNKTKSKVKDIAKDLIVLYAQRKNQQGFGFSPDTYMQHALESSFMYEDTPDQLKATIETKNDMESGNPMDRLICGDVGFGKTEVAIRAAFKAVTDGKQVAVLVPTTILALQHYTTFKERLRDLPCSVDYICRLKQRKDQENVLKELVAGKLDIVIGTHRIVGKDIKFKDLGLLVIDEEQKFGVAVKEKLRHLKNNVDTLTLTATPIPRTMQFSLMGARDLSIIKTPPPNRYPIITELHTFNEDIIREAINYEVDRNGQVFFIHNRVGNIIEIENLIRRLCPDVKVIAAHGQMKGPELEKIMLGFINGYFDVLIATTIIESGLDIPNANTMIIHNAHHFGLSDLHQLRGRVGRSSRKAFCYLLAPPVTLLTPEARRRLKAIEDFSELGSGFNIALQDLDIRGAGDLLGAEQSGFIADLGYETYQRILDEALLELRENELKNINTKSANNGKQQAEQAETKASKIEASGYVTQKHKFVTDCQIDTDMELLFPEEYISSISERMRLYKELDNIESEYSLKDFENQLIDRFGEIPSQTRELLNVIRLRWLAIDSGFEKLILKKNVMLCYFVSNPESSYFQSPLFAAIISYIQKHGSSCQMKERKDKLSLIISNIKTVQHAIKLLDKFKVE